MNGEQLTEFREKLGLKRSAFARALEIDIKTLYNWEHGVVPAGREAALRALEQRMQSQSTETLPVIHADADAPASEHTRAIPLYDAVAAAGSAYGVDMSAQSAPVATVEAGMAFSRCTCAIRVYGDSMSPYYPNGSIVGCREVFNKSEIEYGRVYVIETAENRYIKRIYQSADGDAVRLLSDNKVRYEDGAMVGELIYPELVLPKSSIVRLHKVLAVVEFKAM